MSLRCRVDLQGNWSRRFGETKLMLRCDSPYRAAKLFDENGVVKEWNDPLDALHWLSTDARSDDWIGFLSYDLGRWFEKIPSIAVDDLHLPLFIFTAHRKPDLQVRVNSHKNPDLKVPLATTSTFTRPQYESAIQHVIDYIRAGDIFQVNLSQRFTLDNNLSPAEIYQTLQSQSPAAYAALLEYENFALICNSPELFLKVDTNRKITTRPIKGTRPQLPGMEAELKNSLKDQAELNMIVDLERNDLGRVCEVGSVRVTQSREIESHPTVYHGVATIEGILRSNVSFVDLLRATFPGGSITGAPKIRAMEIIEEIEPVRRGPYCGAIGYLAGDGTMEFNIAIRTMIAKAGKIHIPVGGGIVADSNPAAEYEETLVKAKAMFNALGII